MNTTEQHASEMESVLVDEKEVVKRYTDRVNKIRQRAQGYCKELESRFKINSSAIIHDFGTPFWKEDASLDDNINYLINICSSNYLGGMFALFAQLKAERDRDIMELFLIKSELDNQYSKFKQEYLGSGKNAKQELFQLNGAIIEGKAE